MTLKGQISLSSCYCALHFSIVPWGTTKKWRGTVKNYFPALRAGNRAPPLLNCFRRHWPPLPLPGYAYGRLLKSWLILNFMLQAYTLVSKSSERTDTVSAITTSCRQCTLFTVSLAHVHVDYRNRKRFIHAINIVLYGIIQIQTDEPHS